MCGLHASKLTAWFCRDSCRHDYAIRFYAAARWKYLSSEIMSRKDDISGLDIIFIWSRMGGRQCSIVPGSFSMLLIKTLVMTGCYQCTHGWDHSKHASNTTPLTAPLQPLITSLLRGQHNDNNNYADSFATKGPWKWPIFGITASGPGPFMSDMGDELWEMDRLASKMWLFNGGTQLYDSIYRRPGHGEICLGLYKHYRTNRLSFWTTLWTVDILKTLYTLTMAGRSRDVYIIIMWLWHHFLRLTMSNLYTYYVVAE